MGETIEYTKELVDRVQKRELSVLFVEDNDELRIAMAKSLKLAFKHYDLAVDGKEALELIKSHQYDLVITDMNMPESDGVDLIKSIRGMCKTFPIIITTAHTEFNNIYKDVPNLYLINKPYSIFEILRAVDALEETGCIIIEDNVYDRLEESYSEARKVLDLINKAFKGK